MNLRMGLFFPLVAVVFTVDSQAEQPPIPEQPVGAAQGSVTPRVVEEAKIMGSTSKRFGTRRHDTRHSQAQHYCNDTGGPTYYSGPTQSHYYRGHDSHRQWLRAPSVRVIYRPNRRDHHSRFDDYYYTNSRSHGADTVWYIGPDVRRRHRDQQPARDRHRRHRIDRHRR